MPTDRDPAPERRRLLAQALRAERDRAGLTTRELAARLGWTQAKISHRENGRVRPSIAEVEAWARETWADDRHTAYLLQQASALLSSETSTWADLDADLTAEEQQARYAQLDAECTYMAVYQPTVVPGVAQVAEYARRMFLMLGNTEEEAARKAAGRLARRAVLYREDKTIDLIVSEAALWLRLAPPAVMREQLDALVSLDSLPAVTVHVIPLDADVYAVPITPVVLRRFPNGSEMVTIETLAGETRFEKPDETARFAEALDGYKRAALTGDAAKALIRETAERHDA